MTTICNRHTHTVTQEILQLSCRKNLRSPLINVSLILQLVCLRGMDRRLLVLRGARCVGVGHFKRVLARDAGCFRWWGVMSSTTRVGPAVYRVGLLSPRQHTGAPSASVRRSPLSPGRHRGSGGEGQQQHRVLLSPARRASSSPRWLSPPPPVDIPPSVIRIATLLDRDEVTECPTIGRANSSLSHLQVQPHRRRPSPGRPRDSFAASMHDSHAGSTNALADLPRSPLNRSPLRRPPTPRIALERSTPLRLPLHASAPAAPLYDMERPLAEKLAGR